MKLTFLGATETVTGSRYLLEDDGRKFLVDCGLFQGLKELRLRNWAPFPISPASIDAILLTHAHLDHSGYIPRLVRDGFRGRIYCSEATFDLCKILLPDSGHIQEDDAERANRHGYTKHAPALPLYTAADAQNCLQYFHPVDFGVPHALNDFLRFTLHHAGHILGASFIRVDDGSSSILFSGDLGRMNDPVMNPPAQIQGADYIVVESTYGDRLHDKANPEDDIGAVVSRTVKRGGSVVIPAFAVGRAQSLLYHIHSLKAKGRIPPALPVYLDSPMAINVAELLHKHMRDHRLGEKLCDSICDVARYTRTPAESKEIDAQAHVPSVIIAASGMATAGRVLHHLKCFMEDRRNTILLSGFQAAGTRGDRLARGEKEIKIHGRMLPVRAEVVVLHNMSAHADYEEILAWLGHAPPPRQVFITHGETGSAESLRLKIESRLNWEATVPGYLDSITL